MERVFLNKNHGLVWVLFLYVSKYILFYDSGDDDLRFKDSLLNHTAEQNVTFLFLFHGSFGFNIIHK